MTVLPLRPFLRRALILSVLVAVAGCSNPVDPSVNANVPYSSTDITVGTGLDAAAGDTITVDYIGWLYHPTATDHKGAIFDKSLTSVPFTFVLGQGNVIKGWEQGVPGMKIPGIRRLILPPDLAYGASGSGPIPGNATLVFEIQLLAVTKPTPPATTE